MADGNGGSEDRLPEQPVSGGTPAASAETTESADVDATFGLDRRSLLRGVTAAGGAGLIGLGSATNPAAAIQSGRLSDASQRRQDVATDLIDQFGGDINHDSNDDDTVTAGSSPPNAPYVYTKALTGANNGIIPEPAYDSVVDGIENEEWSKVARTNERPLIAPNASFEFAADGADPWVGTIPAAPAFDSDRTKAELVDLYWMSLLRDEHLEDLRTYVSSYDLGDRDDDFDQFDDTTSLFHEYTGGVGHAFEGNLQHPSGDVLGPPVSQFLVADVDFGAVTLTPDIRYFEQKDYGTTHADWEEIVNGVRGGVEPGPTQTPPEDDSDLSVSDPEASGTRFIHTGRDLAAYVRADPSFDHYYRAAVYLLNRGAPLDPALAYTDDGNVLPYVDHGGVAMLDLVARVARNALLAAWHHKWAIHRRIRPETYAHRVDYYDGHGTEAELDGIKSTNAYSELQALDGHEDSYLPLAYPEGSPAHPSYPSGHSTVAGACVTVLKALTQNVPLSDLSGDYYTVASDGSRSTTFAGPMTVHWELNKLLQNIGLGRCWAGVHFRSDHVYGSLLGEQVAVATLLDHFDYNDNESATSGTVAEEVLTFPPLVDDDFASSEMMGDNDWQVPVTIDTLQTLRTQARNEPI